jgi:hypothetical protein
MLKWLVRLAVLMAVIATQGWSIASAQRNTNPYSGWVEIWQGGTPTNNSGFQVKYNGYECPNYAIDTPRAFTNTSTVVGNAPVHFIFEEFAKLYRHDDVNVFFIIPWRVTPSQMLLECWAAPGSVPGSILQSVSYKMLLADPNGKGVPIEYRYVWNSYYNRYITRVKMVFGDTVRSHFLVDQDIYFGSRTIATASDEDKRKVKYNYAKSYTLYYKAIASDTKWQAFSPNLFTGEKPYNALPSFHEKLDSNGNRIIQRFMAYGNQFNTVPTIYAPPYFSSSLLYAISAGRVQKRTVSYTSGWLGAQPRYETMWRIMHRHEDWADLLIGYLFTTANVKSNFHLLPTSSMGGVSRMPEELLGEDD